MLEQARRAVGRRYVRSKALPHVCPHGLECQKRLCRRRCPLALPHRPSTMSQPPPATQSSGASAYARLHFMQERGRLLGELGALEDITDEASALSWAEDFRKVVVRGFSFIICVDADSSKSKVARMQASLNIPVYTDGELITLLSSAREALLQYATSEWADRAPDLVVDVLDTVRGLAPGVTLRKAFPEMFVDLPQVRISTASSSPSPEHSPASIPSPAATVPGPSPTSSSGGGLSLQPLVRISTASSSPSSEHSPASIPSPAATVPGPSPTPSSGGRLSPQSAPELNVGRASRPTRTLPSRASARRAAPTTESGAVRPANPLPYFVPIPEIVYSPSNPRPPLESFTVKPNKPCARCKHRKQGCRVPAGTDTSSTTVSCGRCIHENVTCGWSPPDPPLSPPVGARSFSSSHR